MRCERVPENVPRNASQPDILARILQSVAETIMIEWPPLRVSEHISGILLPSVQHLTDIDIERNMPHPVIFGRDDLSRAVASRMPYRHHQVLPVNRRPLKSF